MKEIAGDIRRWRERGDEKAALATVVATRGSAPRPIGSKLAVSEQGELAGSVSGGCVESEVAEEAQAVLASGEPKLLAYGISDEQAWSVGLPCGGEIDVFVEEVALTDLAGIAERIERGERFSRTTVIGDDGATFVEDYGPPPRLLVFGAVDTAEALSAAAKQLGWQTIVADARGTIRDRRAHAKCGRAAGRVARRRPRARAAGRGHGRRRAHARGALRHPGARRARSRRMRSTSAHSARAGTRSGGASGCSKRASWRRRIDRIAGPAGLDIGADTTAEVALSILAEILACRAGRSGGALKDGTGRIHAELQPK